MMPNCDNRIVLILLLAAVAPLSSCCCVTAPSLAGEGFSRRRVLLHDLSHGSHIDDQPTQETSSISLPRSLSRDISRASSSYLLASSIASDSSVAVTWEQATRIGSATLPSSLTSLYVPGNQSSPSVERMYSSGIWIVFVSSLTIAIASTSSVGKMQSVGSIKSDIAPTLTMATGNIPAFEETSPPENDSLFKDAIMSFSVYTSPPQSTSLVQSGVITTSTASPLAQTSTSAKNTDVQMHATSTPSSSNAVSPGMISPEVGDMTEIGSPVGVTTTAFIPSSTDTAFPSEGITTSGDSAITSASPTTLMTETSSASTVLESSTWIEATSTTTSEVWAVKLSH